MKHQSYKICQECNFLITKNSPILDWYTIFKAFFFKKLIFLKAFAIFGISFVQGIKKSYSLSNLKNAKISSFSAYSMDKMSKKTQFLGYRNTLHLFRNLYAWQLLGTNWFFIYLFSFWDNRVVGFKPPTLYIHLSKLNKRDLKSTKILFRSLAARVLLLL